MSLKAGVSDHKGIEDEIARQTTGGLSFVEIHKLLLTNIDNMVYRVIDELPKETTAVSLKEREGNNMNPAANIALTGLCTLVFGGASAPGINPGLISALSAIRSQTPAKGLRIDQAKLSKDAINAVRTMLDEQEKKS